MEELQTVHYVAAQDPMQNLKLRVALTRLSASRSKAQEDSAAAQDISRGGPAAASSAAADAAAAAAAASGRPKPFKTARTFAWQEKVYSKAELVAAQAHIRASQQQGRQLTSTKRSAHVGSQSHIGADRLLAASPEGCPLFSYVHTDAFCEAFETRRTVTTSSWEGSNHLAQKLIRDPRIRQTMLNFQSMFVMADLGDEHTAAGSSEKVLCVIRAHHDGSFDMTPGFNAPGHRYRFEDDHGGMYEYVIELASHSAAPSLEKRTAKLAVAVAAQAEEMRRQHSRMEHMPPPGPDASAVRLVLLGELVSAAGFSRDRLYLEWQLTYDPELWVLQHSEQEVPVPGVIQGVSHVSRMVRYPADPATDTPPLWVAHFSHPLEAEWVARAAPAPGDWPRLLLQVKTYDLWDRATTEGYGWLQLAGLCPGSGTHCVNTWKPLGTRRDQQAAFFIGGSQELADPAYAALPRSHKGRVLNRYGFKTESSGSVKVRLHSILQTGAAGSSSPCRLAANRGVAAAAARQRRELSLAVVLERARSRLEEARGGEVIVRDGVISHTPSITVQPLDAAASEGGTAQFSVTATGAGPLCYQWFKDSRRLTVATSNSPLLVLVGLGPPDSGLYHCQVSNKDGAVMSSKALLTISRVGRLQLAVAAGAAAGPTAGDASVGSSWDPAAASSSSPLLSNTLNKRATVPRTLASRTGSPLPYSPRLSSRAAGGSGSAGAAGSSSVPGAGSPLTASLAAVRASAAGRGAAADSGSAAAAAAAAEAREGAAGAAGSPQRRSLAAGAGARGSGAAPPREGWTAGGNSPVRRPITALRQQQQQQQQGQPDHDDLLQHLPPSTFAAAAAAVAAAAGDDMPVAEQSSGSSSEVGPAGAAGGGGDAAAAAAQEQQPMPPQGAHQQAAAGSPARARRTRVSEPQ